MNSVLNYNYAKSSLDKMFVFTALIFQGLEAPGSDSIDCGEIMQTINSLYTTIIITLVKT